MKVTLQRTVMSDVDILLDKQLRPQNAESFFYEVASNLTKKGFVSCKRDSSNGREIWRFKFNAQRKQEIPDYIITSASKRNKDGWGVMWYQDGRVRVKRSLFMEKLPKFLKHVQNFDRIIHLRMATHGTVNIQNCHPFQVNDGLYFAHNGMMSDFSCVKDHKSDTSVFNETVVRPMARLYKGDDLLSEPWFRHTMEKFCGTSQRLAFMDSHGRVLLVGDWTEHKGLWLSNTYAWSEPRVYGTTSTINHWVGHQIDDFYGNKPTVYNYREEKDYRTFWENHVADFLEEEDHPASKKHGNGVANDPEISLEFVPQDADDDLPEEFSLYDLQQLPADDIAVALSDQPDWAARLIKSANILNK